MEEIKECDKWNKNIKIKIQHNDKEYKIDNNVMMTKLDVNNKFLSNDNVLDDKLKLIAIKNQQNIVLTLKIYKSIISQKNDNINIWKIAALNGNDMYHVIDFGKGNGISGKFIVSDYSIESSTNELEIVSVILKNSGIINMYSPSKNIVEVI